MNSFQRLNKPPFAKTLHPETLALHGRQLGTSPSVPIWQTAWNEDPGAPAPRFGHDSLDAIYPSVSNPTQAILEDRLAAFEDGAATLVFSSGQAASAAVVLNVARAGDNFVTSTDLYGGTWVLFANTLRELGIEARFVDPSDPENFRRATDDRTRLYYAETLPNPKLNVFPISEVANIGRALGVPLVMDNTASPLIVRPLEHGAAIVLYSTTKYIGGHGTTIGGAIIDGGSFPWAENAGRFPFLTEQDDEHPGLIWTEIAKPFGPVAFTLRARFKLLANLGATLSPFAAFQILQGLDTLPVRMEQHCANAIVVANYLATHPQSREGAFPRPAIWRTPPPSRCLFARWLWRARRLRAEGGRRSREALHRRAQTDLSRGQHWGRPNARDPPSDHNALAAQRGGPAGDWGHARLCSFVGWDRTSGRHHRGFDASARQHRSLISVGFKFCSL